MKLESSSELELKIALPAERGSIEQFLPQYQADLAVSEILYFDRYWSESDRFPYLIILSGRCVGFALVWRNAQKDCHVVGEFFIAPDVRRRRLGKRAALMLFKLHPGAWELSVLPSNSSGFEFWRTLIRESFEELKETIRVNDGCRLFTFRS